MTLSIDPLPLIDRTSTTFKEECDEYLGVKLPSFSVQVEAARVEILAKEASATEAASTASTAATTATTKAVEAATSATNAANSATAAAGSAAAAANYSSSLSGNSSTSLLIAVASKSFTATTGRQWGTGQFLQAASAANPANYMHGQVTSYNAGTGALVLNVLDVGGSGTYADWVITLSAPKGSTGATGSSGKLTRTIASGTTHTATDGTDILLTNAAGCVVTAPTAVDLARFKVTPANQKRTNSIDFGAATYCGPVGTGTGVLTLNLAAPAEFEYSSTLSMWIQL